MTGEDAIGPRKLRLGSLADRDFQLLCHLVVKLEFGDAHSTEDPDGGADTLLPRTGSEGGWERGWQAKRYESTISWPKCKDSLDRAVTTYRIERMTFCFARDLTKNQLLLFTKHLVGRHPGVRVDFWDHSELLSRLIGSEAGERVARYFFGDPPGDRQAMFRAIRAGGELDTIEKLLERASAIGETLGQHDPFFAYSQHTFETGRDLPLMPGTIMAIARSEDGITVRLDAIPRHDEAPTLHGPLMRVEFDPDEAGQAASEAIDAAVSQRREATVHSGFQITADRLPPLFADLVGKPVRGTMKLTPEPPAPWRATFRAITDRGDATIGILLEPMSPLPPGAHLGFEGRRGGLIATFKGRWVEGRGGQIGVDWEHRFDGSPASEQVIALRFLQAFHGKGKLVISDDQGLRPNIERDLRARRFELGSLLQFFENVVTIEEWIGRPIPMPDTVPGSEMGWVATVAHAIRNRKLNITWTKATLGVEQGGLHQLLPRAAIRIDQELRMNLLGHELYLGHGVLDLPEATIEDRGPSPKDPTVHVVDVLPGDGQPLAADWTLIPPQTDGSSQTAAARRTRSRKH